MFWVSVNAVIWIELPPHGSHMKSKPSAGGSAMGSHSCSLSRAPDPRPPRTQVDISDSGSPLGSSPLNGERDACSVSLLSRRCVVYEWILSERRFSL